MLLWNMDDASRNSILRLLEQDALEESNRHKGKQRGRLQLHQSSTVIQDHKMALSMAKAVSDAGVALTLAAQEENRAFADRKLAFQLAGECPPVHEGSSAHEQLLRLVDTALYEEVASHLDEHDEYLIESYPNKRRCVAESSKTAPSRQYITEVQSECVACNDIKPASDMVLTQCSHLYCKDCMIHLVKDALADQSLFPPRCCRMPIPPSSLRRHLGAELFRSFEEKEIEDNDPYRTYCSNSQCARYIRPPQVDGYVGTCHSCQTKTCTLCKRPIHESLCLNEDDEVMKLAKESGWQQCPQCRYLVELNTGCNHITCRCRCEFCYNCGMKWKTCRCANWDVREVAERIRGSRCQHLDGWNVIEAVDGVDEGGFGCDMCGELHSATNLGIFTRGKRSSPVKTRVLDHGFSETEFLNRASVPEQANQSFQPRNSISILKYDIEIGSTSQARNEAGVKLLRSSVEGAPQQQPPSGNMELDQTDTAIYHESENDPNPREDTVTAPLSQLFPRGEERGGSHERLTVRSQAGQDVCSVVNLPGEYGTMQQLDFHLHSPKESVTIGPARKYWTLDELKNLMQQRISSWKSKAEDNMMTLAPQLQQSSRKRKRTSSQEGEASHTELPKKSRIRGQGQRLDIKRTGKSTSPRISILDSCSLPVGCIDFPLGKPLSAHGQIYHAIEGNEFQPQRPCRDRGAILFCDEDTSFVSQAFDAAYEVIMRSERDAPLDLSDVVSMRRESTGNNEGGISMQAPWEWGSEDEEPMLNSSRIGKEMLLSSRKDRGPAFDTTGGRYYDQQHTYIGGLYINREPLLTIEENSTTELRQALGRKGPEANRLNLDVGPMKNFWRQNKLY
ncbi:hypothetical protein BJX76DRAFT_351848 [Aspergillus varians]